MVPHFIIISGIIVFEAFRRNQLPPPWLILAVVGTMIGGSIVISWWSDRKKRKGRPLVQARIVGRHERR